MRTAFLIPLAFTAAMVAGCGDEVSNTSERDETASRAAASLHRDLTLSVSQAPATEVASAVELSAPKPAPAPARRHRPRPKPVPAPAPAPVAEPEHDSAEEPEATPATTPTLGEALAQATVVDDASSGGRELAPGKTITIIPVSSGPSVEADEGDSWLPSGPSRGVLVGGGGTCRRRGGAGGIGIAARFRVSIPAISLR
jgi:hypothetical protein